jgi:hypothetical protein
MEVGKSVSRASPTEEEDEMASKKASTSKKKSKKAAAADAAIASLALEAKVAEAVDAGCGPCVVAILAKASGKKPKPTTKLKDLFNNCNPGLITALQRAFANCPNADPNAEFTCNSTIEEIVSRVCGE